MPSITSAQAEDTVRYVLEEVRVETARLAAEGVPLARLPYAAQVVQVGELADPAAATAADLLRDLPGVTTADEFGSPFQLDIRMRGFQVSPVVGLPQGVSVFVDGVRVNEPDASQVNFNLIPLHALERVEVIRTPGGPFGRNALAGSIHFVTRSGAGAPAGAVELTGGSFGTGEASGWVAGSMPAGLHYLVSGRLHRSEGWRDLNRSRLSQGFAKLGWRDDRSDLSVSYTAAEDYLEAPGSLPSSWLEGTLPPDLQGTRDPRRLQFTGFEGDWFRPRLHFLVGNASHDLGRGRALQVNTFLRSNRFVQANDNITEPNVRGETEITSIGTTAQLTGAWASGLSAAAGLEYVRNAVGIRIFEVANAAFPTAAGMTEHVSSRDDNAAAFAHLRAPLGAAVGLTASMRYDWIALPITDHLEPENGGENRFRQLTGSLGADWMLAPRLRVFGSYGRGFRAPVILEIMCADPEDPCPLPFELGADPPLDPVTTDTWQAGARWLAGAGAELEAVGYWAEVHDDLFHVVATPATRGYFKNLDRTRRRGLELTGTVRALPILGFRGTLALTRATFETHAELSSALLDDDDDDAAEAADDDPDRPAEGVVSVEPGDRFAMIPAVSWSAGVELDPGPWSFSANGSYQGRQYLVGDEANEEEFGMLPAYFVLDAAVEREIGSLRVFAHGSNLLDAEHHTFGLISPNVRGPEEGPQPFLSPGLPRRIMAGVRYVF